MKQIGRKVRRSIVTRKTQGNLFESETRDTRERNRKQKTIVPGTHDERRATTMRSCLGRILVLFHYYVFVLVIIIPNKVVDALESFFANVTLTANNGDLSAVIYLPSGLKPDDRTYYASTRFDWSSMIGSITRTTTNPLGEKETHSLYGTKQWRLPHDPYWPESGVGLASEFGVGDDGSLCNFMCGWDQTNEVTNGVLGYQEAKNGDSFLKIGVGELIKGSCSTCDSAEDYKFNSPYKFAKTPVWTLKDKGDGKSITLSHKAVLGNNGYKLGKQITLNDDQLLIKTSLTNLGKASFSTAWYSHHFFTCDTHPVELGYSVDYDLSAANGEYNEPSTWSWATPIVNYAKIVKEDDKVRIEMERGVESNVRIKVEFDKDDQAKGEFTIRACNTAIRETIPEIGNKNSGISMNAYNLYIESGTFSPEPQILLNLLPGKTTSWTQQLDFADNYPPPSSSSSSSSSSLPLNSLLQSVTSATTPLNSPSNHHRYDSFSTTSLNFVTIIALAITIGTVLYRSTMTRRRDRRRKQNYVPVPDHHDHGDNETLFNRCDQDVQ
ncbi:MAG: hypothetical protein ACI8RD_005093 [Bacillariaceae sp.]